VEYKIAAYEAFTQLLGIRDVTLYHLNALDIAKESAFLWTPCQRSHPRPF
jgi:hypothetical protein